MKSANSSENQTRIVEPGPYWVRLDDGEWFIMQIGNTDAFSESCFRGYEIEYQKIERPKK